MAANKRQRVIFTNAIWGGQVNALLVNVKTRNTEEFVYNGFEGFAWYVDGNNRLIDLAGRTGDAVLGTQMRSEEKSVGHNSRTNDADS